MPTDLPDPTHENDAQAKPADLPASLVPRWLALLVLIALLSAAGFSVHSVLSAELPTTGRQERSADPDPR